jgi:hypothetical protein
MKASSASGEWATVMARRAAVAVAGMMRSRFGCGGVESSAKAFIRGGRKAQRRLRMIEGLVSELAAPRRT